MTTKTVYQHDEVGIYVGPAVAYESPLDPGVYHIPARCVEPQPPEPTSGYAAVWTGDAWQEVPDHRGETWYLDGQPVVISELGDPAASGHVTTPPPPTPPTIAELKAHAAAKRYAVEQGGIEVAGISVATDDRSKALIDGTVGYLADGGPSPITFKATSGWVELDLEAVRAIKQAIGAHIQACFAAEAAVEAAIDAGTVTTVAEIDAWAWPVND